MDKFFSFLPLLFIVPLLNAEKTGSSCSEPEVNQYSSYVITTSPHPDPELEDSRPADRYPEGSVLKYRCDPDMVLEGEMRQQCHHGQWSAKPPRCYFDIARKSKVTSLTPAVVDGNFSSQVNYTAAINKTRELLMDFFYTRQVCRIELYSNTNLSDTHIHVVFYKEGRTDFKRELLSGKSDKVPSGYRYTLIPPHQEGECPSARNISLKHVQYGPHLLADLKTTFLQEIKVFSNNQEVILEQCFTDTSKNFYAIPFTDGQMCYYGVHEKVFYGKARKLCLMFHPEANLSVQTSDEFYKAFSPILNTGHDDIAMLFIGKRPHYMWSQSEDGRKICPSVRALDHMVDNTWCTDKMPFLCQAKPRSCQLPPFQQFGPHRLVLPDGEHVQYVGPDGQVEEKRCELGQLK